MVCVLWEGTLETNPLPSFGDVSPARGFPGSTDIPNFFLPDPCDLFLAIVIMYRTATEQND